MGLNELEDMLKLPRGTVAESNGSVLGQLNMTLVRKVLEHCKSPSVAGDRSKAHTFADKGFFVFMDDDLAFGIFFQ